MDNKLNSKKRTTLILAIGFVFGLLFPTIKDKCKEILDETILNEERGGYTVFVKAQNVGFLKKGDRVICDGAIIGRVKDVRFFSDIELGAECVIRKNAKIENTSIAKISSTDFSGSNQCVYIRRMPHFIEDKIKPKFHSENDTISANYEGGIYDWMMRDSVNFFQKIDYIYSQTKASSAKK